MAKRKKKTHSARGNVFSIASKNKSYRKAKSALTKAEARASRAYRKALSIAKRQARSRRRK